MTDDDKPAAAIAYLNKVGPRSKVEKIGDALEALKPLCLARGFDKEHADAVDALEDVEVLVGDTDFEPEERADARGQLENCIEYLLDELEQADEPELVPDGTEGDQPDNVISIEAAKGKKGKKEKEPKPEPLSDEEINRISALLEEDGVLFPSPSKPMPVARKLMTRRTEHQFPILKHWGDSWMLWDEAHWIEIEDKTVRAAIYVDLEKAQYITAFGPKPWEPNRYKINDVLDALRGIIHLPQSNTPPCWLPASVGTDDPVIAAQNGLLNVRTRELRPLTPGSFNLVSVPFAYDANAPEPTRWLEFLHQLWLDDEESIKALQDFFGYVISGKTELQKIFVITGPIRSGKGTIARILTAMVGRGHVANPTLSSLGHEFGLAPLLGKSLAIIGDARLGPKPDTRAVIERLLSISGEDAITVNRKFRDQVSVRLPTRFMIISNELPAFGDASGAIASRFILTTLTRSFLGEEDTELEAKLAAELPGILNWALAGLDRISHGRFTVPTSSAKAVAQLQDLVSPMSKFVRECCDQGGPDKTVVIDTLYGRYRDWCADEGLKPLPKTLFGRDLRAVLPRLDDEHPHGQKRRYVGIALKERSIGTHNALSSGSSGSSGSSTDLGPDEPDEPRESSLPLPIDEFLSAGNGRCPACKWHAATQGHRADCPHFETKGARS